MHLNHSTEMNIPKQEWIRRKFGIFSWIRVDPDTEVNIFLENRSKNQSLI